MPIKVLFDISMLGVGHKFIHSRTGIFRVVENLALGLNAHKDCETIFCALQTNFAHCREYLDANSDLNEAFLSEPDDILSRIYNTSENLRLRIADLPEKKWKTPFRKAYHFGKKFIRPINQKDLILCDVFHSPWLALPKQVRKNTRLCKMITIHDLIAIVHPEFFHSSISDYMKIVFNSITPDTHMLCVSDATRNDLLNYMSFLNADNVHTVYLAADDCFQHCNDAEQIDKVKQKYKIQTEGNYFLALSTLQPRKNFERIINSFIDLLRAESINDLSLVLVGSKGWNFEHIYQEIEGAGEFADKIILTGHVSDEDLAPLYSGALAFVYPSLYEGFGLPPLEAMQCGTPVITSNNSSLPEVVGDAAIKIDPRDGDALCQEMLNVYKDEALRLRLSAAGIERARSFSWEKTTQQTVAAYSQALSNK